MRGIAEQPDIGMTTAITEPEIQRESTRILIVDDSEIFTRLVRKIIADRIPANVVAAESFTAARQMVSDADSPFHLALVDIRLPDSSEGEAVQYLAEKGIPCIVVTNIFSEEFRQKVLSWNVIDYIIKDIPAGIGYLGDIVERMHLNRYTKVLVVDDSRTSRRHMRNLLVGYQCFVIEAQDGDEALKLLDAQPDIRLAIVDFHMPGMNGVELVQRIRTRFDRDDMGIIGITSGPGGAPLSAQFIKFGADDFISKPFLPEEFFCRVTHILRMLDILKRFKDLAVLDPLTGIHNRRFFFEAGRNLMASSKRKQVTVTAAIVDLDYFKHINDENGHEAGDLVLKGVADLLRRQCRQTDIVARFGGEEFVILAVNVKTDAVRPFFEKLRAAIETLELDYMGRPIKVTASFGVCSNLGETLEDMLREADAMLYSAKKNGRNRIEMKSAA
jgi:diguanylate cyclase (GGDEF)-like protein